MHEAIPPLPNTSSWRSAQLKHRDNFTFHFYLYLYHAPTADKDDDIKDSFYEELEQVFDQFPRYHMKILLGDFNAKVGREDIFKPIISNQSLHEASNDSSVRAVNFATSKNLIIKSTFPHRDIHKHTWTSPDGVTHNQIDHVMIDKRQH
jgi:endonuclease/exonuclease/phosphatase family metal-dependent hydrolase